MIDIDKLAGFEFEELIGKLLRKMGFIVEQTSLSADGGVDIVAYSKEPIFKGKYLIQCKRWSGVIGEPVVRDLYGVVLSQNANKGIVITNSYFSEKAIKFAENKNIELIDGNILSDLIKKYLDFQDNDSISIDNIKDFKTNEDFDVDKYNYYREQMEKDRRNKEKYLNLLRFLYSYITAKKYDIIYSGLINECCYIADEILTRFCNKGREGLALREVILNIKAFLYILMGNLDKSFEILKELKLLRPIGVTDDQITPTKYVIDRDIKTGKESIKLLETDFFSETFVVRNLLVVFKGINFMEGADYIKNLFIKGNENSLKKVREGLQRFSFTPKLDETMVTLNIDLFNKSIDDIYSGIEDKIYIPTEFYVEKRKIYGYGTKYFSMIKYNNKLFFNVNDIIDNSLKNIAYQKQLTRIKFLMTV